MDASAEKDFLEQLLSDSHDDKLTLPTLPEIALEVRDTLADEDSSLCDVAKIIGKDAALSGRLIQVVNSPLLRTGNVIEDINAAVMRMGGTMVRNLVTSIVMEQLFQAKSSIVEKRLRATWQRSVDISSFVFALNSAYSNIKLESDQAMLAGLVHDIGVLPILTRAEDYPELLEDEDVLDRIIAEAHTSIGAAILEKWHFPEELVLVAKEHENLQYDSVDGPDYVDIVIVANLQSGADHNAMNEEDMAAIPAFRKLGLSAEVEVIDMSVDADLATALLNA